MNKLATVIATVMLASAGTSTSAQANIFESARNAVAGNTCGVPLHVYQSVKAKYRGPVDGGTDEDGDGKVSFVEAFTTWDFAQTEYVLHSGVEHQEYKWTNIDTCYKFHVVAGDFYEDKDQPVLWQTCRNFRYWVIDPEGNNIGGENHGKGCRNFGTFEWWII